MLAYDDFSMELTNNMPALILAVLLAVTLFVLIVVTVRFKMQQYSIFRRDMNDREVAGRRRIKLSDKRKVFERDNYTCQICGISKGILDSFCEGLGDYLLLEVDHIQSVSQGGTGRDIDNLQCLCWRCNRKKGGLRTNDEVREMIDYGVDYIDEEEPYDKY
jgi:5-methylcytosine-specific restriction endonuclease McrA